jgi:hypothetical protein
MTRTLASVVLPNTPPINIPYNKRGNGVAALYTSSDLWLESSGRFWLARFHAGKSNKLSPDKSIVTNGKFAATFQLEGTIFSLNLCAHPIAGLAVYYGGTKCIFAPDHWIVKVIVVSAPSPSLPLWFRLAISGL